MKLIELLSIIDEHSKAVVYHNNEIITSYNGKDSIEEEYNDCIVISVYAIGGTLIIDVD